MRQTHSAVARTVIVATLLGTAAAQGPWHELSSPDPADHAWFASALALDAGRLMVGQPHLDENPGRVYLHERTGGVWSVMAKLVPSTSSPGDRFGESLALHGDRLIVGAGGGNAAATRVGLAVVFDGSGGTWTEDVVVVDPVGASGDRFGASVDLDGDVVLVGAPAAHAAAVRAGKALIFRHVGGVWLLESQLIAPNGRPNGLFGTSVAIDGNLALVGEPGTRQQAGSAHLWAFDGVNWNHLRTLEPLDLQPGDLFGRAVALDEGRAAIGAIGDSTLGSSAGAVHVFEVASGWARTAVLRAADGGTQDLFGRSLELRGSRLLVGAPIADGVDGDQFQGTAYSFLHDPVSGWDDGLRLESPFNVGFLDESGSALAMDEGSLAIGRPGAGYRSGRLMILDTDLGVAYCSTNQNSTGQTAAIVGWGSPIVTDDFVVLTSHNLPAGRVGYFLFSDSQDFVPFFGGSQGILCLGQRVHRFANDLVNSDAGGRATFRLRLDDLPGGVQFSAGESWNFQFWFRDQNPGPTSNTTDGLTITFQ